MFVSRGWRVVQSCLCLGENSTIKQFCFITTPAYRPTNRLFFCFSLRYKYVFIQLVHYTRVHLTQLLTPYRSLITLCLGLLVNDPTLLWDSFVLLDSTCCNVCCLCSSARGLACSVLGNHALAYTINHKNSGLLEALFCTCQGNIY